MKITPALRKPRQKTVDYSELNDGDCFYYDGNIYMKLDNDYCDQVGLSLNEPEWDIKQMCGTRVIPIDVEIKWSFQKQPAVKKAKKK